MYINQTPQSQYRQSLSSSGAGFEPCPHLKALAFLRRSAFFCGDDGDFRRILTFFPLRGELRHFSPPSEIYDAAIIFSGCPSFATCDSPGPEGSISDPYLHRFFTRSTTTSPSVYKLLELIDYSSIFPENSGYFLSTLCPNSKFKANAEKLNCRRSSTAD